jgi:hypothetical protein
LKQVVGEYRLTFNKRWLAAHPLTQAGLAQERDWLAAFGINFRYS